MKTDIMKAYMLEIWKYLCGKFELTFNKYKRTKNGTRLYVICNFNIVYVCVYLLDNFVCENIIIFLDCNDTNLTNPVLTKAIALYALAVKKPNNLKKRQSFGNTKMAFFGLHYYVSVLQQAHCRFSISSAILR